MKWDWYTLASDGKTPIPLPPGGLLSLTDEQKRVAITKLPNGYVVSTVFLGLDQEWIDDQPPVLWETMVFGPKTGWVDLQMQRYSSYDDAVAGHRALCDSWKLMEPQHGEEPEPFMQVIIDESKTEEA